MIPRAGTLPYKIIEKFFSGLYKLAINFKINEIYTIRVRTLNFFSFLWGKKFFHFFLDFSPIREFVDSCQVANPFGRHSNTEISVVIPCHPKDLEILPIVLTGLEKNCLNSILEIVVISPEIININFETKLNLRFLRDSEVLNASIFEAVTSTFSKSQFGWIIQQVLKIMSALKHTKSQNILVLDSDTILTKPTVFVDGKRQILSITREYHRQYINQYQNFSNSTFDSGFSYVTHFQVWQSDILNSLWGGVRLFDWLIAADLSSSSSISEYQTYGSYLVQNFPDRFEYARWGNVELGRSENEVFTYESISKACPNARSVSIHSYS